MKLRYHHLITGIVMCMTMIDPNVAISQETPKDAAIVVAVSGAVMYSNQTTQQSPAPVQSFMKMYQDDVLTLPVETQVKLLYPKGGRKETWVGPVVIILGEEESTVQKGQNAEPSQVEHLPKIARSVRETNLPLIERGGVIIVRASESHDAEQPTPTPMPLPLTDEERAEIEAAKAAYTEMKTRSATADVTPALYLLSVLASYDQYQEMQPLIEELLKIHPDNKVLRQWEEWVNAQQSEH